MERCSCIYSACCSALLQLWTSLSLCQLTDCCRRGKVQGDKVGEAEGRRGEGEGMHMYLHARSVIANSQLVLHTVNHTFCQILPNPRCEVCTYAHLGIDLHKTLLQSWPCPESAWSPRGSGRHQMHCNDQFLQNCMLLDLIIFT